METEEVLREGPIHIVSSENDTYIVERKGLQEVNIPGVIYIPKGQKLEGIISISDSNELVWHSPKNR